ncbi:MAG TPA: SOS response-associated peptidase [Microlunatus sp.]|nr:SOS response-associated peptidase [Microlunatus sp.]
MCGRYALSADPDELVREYDIAEVFAGLPGPDYNVAPTATVPAVLERTAHDTGEVRRRLAPLVWGLVPSWSKQPTGGARMINARVETVAEKPAFRRAFSLRRCILPADGFYEWYVPEASAPGAKASKQPFFIHRRDGGRLAMAGIYEIWRDPDKDPEAEDAWLRTCSVITTQATDAAGHIHDRMPMVIRREVLDRWLDPTLTDSAQALELLSVTDADQLEAYAVSKAVGNVRNNDPSLLAPIGVDDEPATLI